MEIKGLIQSTTFRLANLLFWFTLFVFSWGKHLIINKTDALYNVIYWPGAYFLILFLLSPLVFFIFLNTIYLDVRRFIHHHIIYGVLFGVLHFILTGVSILLLERLFKFGEHYTLSSLLVYFKEHWIILFEGVAWYVLTVLILLTIHYAMLYQNERKQVSLVKSDLASSNLQLLTTQLSPHFLFNAMNNISMMVRRDENKKAVSMIAALSDMLRMAMTKRHNQLVSLKSEIDLLQKYLLLEKERFKDRVDVKLSFSEEMQLCSVPTLVLQPLVENAFKHGVANSMSKSFIEVSGKKEGTRLILSVFNSGQAAVNWDMNNASSLGLPNTIHRLRQLYESDFSFKVIEQEEGVLFQISLPFLHL